jgi:cell division protein FtsI/penicillin-binding protein 2
VFRSAAILSLALVLLLPEIGRASKEAELVIDPATIALDEDGASARLENGASAELSLEPKLQVLAERLLVRSRAIEGAALLLDPKSGRVLAFAEVPGKGRPKGSVIFNTRIPAASVFKLVTTTALLEEGGVTPALSVCTWGGNHGIERRHLDKPKRGRSVCAPFGVALGHSRNAVYAQLATHRLSRSELMQTARRLGFNQKAAFDANVFVGHLSLPYNDLEFARAAAGFRGSSLSPIGAAHLASIVANGGVATRLRIVKSSGEFVAPEGAEVIGRVMKATTAHALTRMMEVTVREGTSKDAFHDKDGRSYFGNMRVAGKTGTLQSSEKGSTTSWFTGFAPSRQPEVVVTVLLSNGKVWHEKANEVARDLLRGYFHARGRRGIGDPLEAQR